MNVTIGTNAAKSAAAARVGKLSGVENSNQKQTETKAEETTRSRKFDTVGLSSDAKKYLSEENETTETVTTETADVTTEAETVDSSQLYSYTDDELDDLLSNGDITQLEYNIEMAKRSSGTEE